MRKIIEISGGLAANPEIRLDGKFDFCLCDGEHLFVSGDNAQGKTRFLQCVAGITPLEGDVIQCDFSPSPLKLLSENVRYISFNDAYGTADGGYYLQKRWNQQDIDEEDVPTAGAVLDRAFEVAESADARSGIERTRTRSALRDRLYRILNLDPLRDKFIISLSSGELRKVNITKVLLMMPRVLIIENPFIGLDSSTRIQVADLLGTLSRESGISFILSDPRVDVVPEFITHIIEVNGLKVGAKIPVGEHRSVPLSVHTEVPSGGPEATDGKKEIVRLNSVSIRYGQRTILSNLDWTVREGERWAVGGANGSGKSTLFSLVCADNPQSYACDIELFGHRRGSGESIWEIKRHIGYVSPEMHRAYLKNISALDVVASGLFDTVGLFMTPSEPQLEVCRQWMDIFGIGHLAGRPYLRISSGEQRLCLLARAFVKDPELLILDEPMHGLDWGKCEMVKDIVNRFVEREHKTLLMVSHYEQELPSCINRRLELVAPERQDGCH